MSVFIAPDDFDPDSLADPVIFLAGPIQGAPDWQTRATELILQKCDLHVANPRRPHARPGEFRDKDYAEQVNWESRWLSRACRHGAILFWLAREIEHDCDRAYAQTTRFELGEWSGKIGPLAIGIEEGFTGARYIRHRLGQRDHEAARRATFRAGTVIRDAYAIQSTLEATVELAVRIANH